MLPLTLTGGEQENVVINCHKVTHIAETSNIHGEKYTTVFFGEASIEVEESVEKVTKAVAMSLHGLDWPLPSMEEAEVLGVLAGEIESPLTEEEELQASNCEEQPNYKKV